LVFLAWYSAQEPGAELLGAIPSYRRDHFCSQKHTAAAKTQHAPISGISEMNVRQAHL
jgi:hypothetical protein